MSTCPILMRLFRRQRESHPCEWVATSVRLSERCACFFVARLRNKMQRLRFGLFSPPAGCRDVPYLVRANCTRGGQPRPRTLPSRFTLLKKTLDEVMRSYPQLTTPVPGAASVGGGASGADSARLTEEVRVGGSSDSR